MEEQNIAGGTPVGAEDSSAAGSEGNVRAGTPLGMDRSEGEARAAGRSEDRPETKEDPGEQRARSQRDRPESPEARRARYKAMVEGEFKDLYTADTQRIIDKRFRETRELQETLAAQRPVLERLMDRYGVPGGDLAGLVAAMDREEDLRALEQERFSQLLAQAARQAAEERERALTEDIRARGTRPAENGAGAQNGLTARIDVARMTREERRDIARRVARGEIITF